MRHQRPPHRKWEELNGFNCKERKRMGKIVTWLIVLYLCSGVLYILSKFLSYAVR